MGTTWVASQIRWTGHKQEASDKGGLLPNSQIHRMLGCKWTPLQGHVSEEGT